MTSLPFDIKSICHSENNLRDLNVKLQEQLDFIRANSAGEGSEISVETGIVQNGDTVCDLRDTVQWGVCN